MKRKIIVGISVFSLLFIAGGLYIVYTIDRSTTQLDQLIRLHQVEILREHYLLQIKRGQSEVHFDVTPRERGAGYEFQNVLVGMNVPRNFVPAVEKGILESLKTGVLASYPMVDLKVRFYDGKSHEVDSSEMAFKIAASMCLKKAVQEGNPVLLEPIVKMEIIVPEESMGDVMGDLNSRRGRVLGMDVKGKVQVIKAQAPLAEVLKYAIDLNALTAGRGTFRIEPSHYEEVPAQLSEKVIAEAKKSE